MKEFVRWGKKLKTLKKEVKKKIRYWEKNQTEILEIKEQVHPKSTTEYTNSRETKQKNKC